MACDLTALAAPDPDQPPAKQLQQFSLLAAALSTLTSVCSPLPPDTFATLFPQLLTALSALRASYDAALASPLQSTGSGTKPAVPGLMLPVLGSLVELLLLLVTQTVQAPGFEVSEQVARLLPPLLPATPAATQHGPRQPQQAAAAPASSAEAEAEARPGAVATATPQAGTATAMAPPPLPSPPPTAPPPAPSSLSAPALAVQACADESMPSGPANEVHAEVEAGLRPVHSYAQGYPLGLTL